METNLKKRFDSLFVWFLGNQNSPRLVGEARLVGNGKAVSLSYDAAWLADGFALSEDLPLRVGEQLPRLRDRAIGALDDARPDRWGEKVIRYVINPARQSLMEFLYYAGDDRFGALGLSTSASTYQPHSVSPLPRLEAAQQLSEIVSKINEKVAITELEKKLIVAGGSIGGAKPKALIEIAGEQWMLKFFNGEPVDSPLIEHATMTLCAKADIVVAETRLVPLVSEHAVAVKRFDRDAQGPIHRKHCISAGTALRASVDNPENAEMSYPALAQVLRRSGVTEDGWNRRDMAELFRRMVFNILMDNTDDHEKNHSLEVMPLADEEPLSRRRFFRLSPAYDVLPTNSGQGRQEFSVGDNGTESSLENAMSQHSQFGLTYEEARALTLKVIAVVNTWQDHFKACGVCDADIAALATVLDGPELGQQRKDFSKTPASPLPTVKRSRRRNPFAQ